MKLETARSNTDNTLREEIQEAREILLDCARRHGVNDAANGVTIPPVEFCEDTKSSKMLLEAWLEGWNSVPNPAPAKLI